MIRANGLLDTSVVILLPRLAGADLPSQPAISTLTLAELYVGPVAATGRRQVAERQREVRFAEEKFDPLPFDAGSARAYAAVVRSMRAAGRKSASRTTDALIASVAMAHGLPLYTCDPADFAGIEGLKVVPVPHPDRN